MPSQEEPQENPARRRIAWILVISMSLLLALAFLGLVWGFMRQGRVMMEAKQAATPAPVAATAGPLATLTLAAGVRIVSAQAEGGRQVLHLTGPGGDEVQVLDMATGALTHQVRTAPAK